MALHLGEPWVLLGAEPTRTGPAGVCTKSMCTLCATYGNKWVARSLSEKSPAGKDFGGLREAADADVAATASREFAEETLGIFACCDVDAGCVEQSAQQMSQQIRRRELMIEVVHELRQVVSHLYGCSLVCPLG